MVFFTAYWTFIVIIFLFFVFIVLYLYGTRNFSYWKRLGIKVCYKPVAFFGNFASCLFSRQTPEEFLRSIYNAGKGEQFTGYYVLNEPHLLIRDPELIKHVLVKDSTNFLNRFLSGNPNDGMSNTNVFLVKNPAWKPIRQMLSPVFTSGRLKVMFEMMLEICKDFETYLESLKLEGKGKIVEVKEICAMFMTDLIGISAYGMRFNSLTDPNAEIRKHGRSMFRSSYRRYIEFLTMMFIPKYMKLLDARFFDSNSTNFLRRIFWETIDERIEKGIKRVDLLDLLIEARKNQEKEPNKSIFKLQGDTMISQAAIFFTGGFETSSTTMSFALYELAKNPNIQTRLRNEILKALQMSNGGITYDMITSLPYLHMVVSETLRMYPVIPFIDRIPENDYQFPGTKLIIKKGTPVILPMRALHMDPEYFQNPEQFDPERFNEENKKRIVPYTYFPFGEGPRACMGIRVGYMQTKLGLIHFISKYELTPCQKTLIPMEFDNLYPWMGKKNANYLTVREINVTV